MFSPDSDCIQVATKCWDWLLWPNKFNQYLEKEHGFLLLSENREEKHFKQSDPLDDLFSLDMLHDFIKENSESDKPVMYGTDITLSTLMDNQYFTLS